MMTKYASAIGIALPSVEQMLNHTPVLTGECAVIWRDVSAPDALYSVVCYVNGFPHKRILSLNLDALVKRIREWLADPIKVDP